MPDFVLYCPACDRTYPLDTGLFSCPKARPGEEHTLRKIFGPKAALTIPAQDLLARWKSGDRNSFSLYQGLLGSRDLLGADRFSILLDYFRKPMATYEGKCFEVTPLTEAPGIREILRGQGRIWIKDETDNITGSHKGRHLMGTLLYLEVLRLLRQKTDKRVLAIYSCGNAALAAAAVARAGSYELHAFVPRDMNPAIQQMLVDRDAAVERIPRDETGEGDPCYLAFREAVEQKGWLPFACSGPDNWSNIEGGETLGGETVLQLREAGAEPACMVLQIGGGALARAVAQAWDLLRRIEIVDTTPRIYVCQSEGGFPFVRAYYRMLKRIADHNGLPMDWNYDPKADPADQLDRLRGYAAADMGQVIALSAFVQENFEKDAVQKPLARAVTHRNEFMWAWDGAAPRSAAHGILDDETYDWYDLLRAVLKSGGKAEILREGVIQKAHHMARTRTGIRVSATGSAGLAGLLQLRESGDISDDEDAVLFFTGVDRP